MQSHQDGRMTFQPAICSQPSRPAADSANQTGTSQTPSRCAMFQMCTGRCAHLSQTRCTPSGRRSANPHFDEPSHSSTRYVPIGNVGTCEIQAIRSPCLMCTLHSSAPRSSPLRECYRVCIFQENSNTYASSSVL